jgi:hypothetical protein
MVPENEFWLKLRVTNPVKDPIVDGIIPCNRLENSCRRVREENIPIEGGNDPCKFNRARLKRTTLNEVQTTPVQPVPSKAFVVVPDVGQIGTEPVGVEPVQVQPDRPVEPEIARAKSHIADTSSLAICP